MFQFAIPTRIVYGPGSVAALPDEIQRLGRKPLIVTDPGLVEGGIVERAAALLSKRKLPFAVYDRVEPNVAMANVFDGAALFRSESCDCLVGLGGGSAMDCAKMVGALVTNGGHIRDYGYGAAVPQPIPPLVCVPTTCGTGSEVTFNALFHDHERNLKVPLSHRNIAAQVGILDGELLASCPPHVIASTGMDALTHAIESYTNTRAHPMADALGIEAIGMIGANLRAATSGRWPDALQNQLTAACLAALPLMMCGVGLVHAMSNPLSGHFGVAHGIANSILLPIVMEYNLIGGEAKFARIAQALGEDITGLSVHDAAKDGIEAVRKLFFDLPLPRTLGQVGVKLDKLEAMVEDTFRSANIPINPRRMLKDDVKELFVRAIEQGP